MNKDEEIKHLTELNTRTIDRNGRLNRELKSVQAPLEGMDTNTDLSSQLKALEKSGMKTRMHLTTSLRFEGLCSRDNLVDQNMQLQNMLYGIIGMLSEQNAETVLSQLDKLQRAMK